MTVRILAIALIALAPVAAAANTPNDALARSLGVPQNSLTTSELLHLKEAVRDEDWAHVAFIRAGGLTEWDRRAGLARAGLEAGPVALLPTFDAETALFAPRAE